MPERKAKPPEWGPVTDPSPYPWPPWDPIPWYWKQIPRLPEGDPIPFPYKILEQIRIEDFIALRMASLETVNQVIQAQMELLGKQQEILAKYQ